MKRPHRNCGGAFFNARSTGMRASSAGPATNTIRSNVATTAFWGWPSRAYTLAAKGSGCTLAIAIWTSTPGSNIARGCTESIAAEVRRAFRIKGARASIPFLEACLCISPRRSQGRNCWDEQRRGPCKGKFSKSVATTYLLLAKR
jgi:hypothetical protein